MVASTRVFACLFISFQLTSALYEDQVGKFDWRQKYVGRPSKVVFDTTSRPRLTVATDENVIASLSSKSGDIEWRRVIEQGLTDVVLFPGGRRIAIALTTEPRMLQSWDADAGLLKWQRLLSEKHTGPMIMSSIGKGKVAVASSTALSIVDLDGETMTPVGGLKNYANLIGMHRVPETEELVIVSSASTSSIPHVVVVNLRDLSVEAPKPLFSVPSLFSDCSITHGHLACLQSTVTGFSLHFVSLKDREAPQTFHIEGAPKGSKAVVILQRDSDQMDCSTVGLHVQYPDGSGVFQVYKVAGTGTVEESMKLTEVDVGGLVGCHAVIGQYAINPSQSAAVTAFQWFDLLTGQPEPDYRMRMKHSAGQAMVNEIMPMYRKNRQENFVPLVMALGADDAMALLSPSDKHLWTRHEALAGVLSVEMLELPLSEAQANIEEEFSSEISELSVIHMFLRRVKSQIHQIHTLLTDLLQESVRVTQVLDALRQGHSISHAIKTTWSGKDDASMSHPHRDYFGLHRMIVVATRAGKLYGIDSRQGNVVWQLYVDNLRPLTRAGHEILPIYVLRTTGHYPYQAVVSVLGKGTADSSTTLVSFEPISGALVERQDYDFTTKQAILMPTMNAEGMRKLLFLTQSDEVVIYNSVGSEPHDESSAPVYTFTADEPTGSLSGYKITLDNSGTNGKVSRTWTTQLPMERGSMLTSIKMKNPAEHVHSQGRVLGDRSVLYKYLNPNLAVATVEHSDGDKSQISVTLFDAVTGAVVSAVEHKRANGPVQLVHCENFIVYTYWNMKARRTELAVLELYEGTAQADPVRFSSFTPPGPPIVMRQSYVVPFAVTVAGVTNTEKGLTTRHLLLAMPSGGILQVPKMFVDPRRPILPTPEHREEGLIPYIPELHVQFEQVVNYNQTLAKVRGIYAGPSGLESTSLVFIYGLDLYSTRLTPSGTFDILKEDFEHWFIAAVVIGLTVATLVSKKFAKHRDLKQAWK